MRYTSGCKINIGLRILDKRPDGYHNLETIFYPLDNPFDEIFIEKTEIKGLELTCNIVDIDLQHNTLTKAYNLYNAHNPVDFGMKVHLNKGVPHGAGLGGGSANAGVILQYLQKQAKNKLDFDTLITIASKIGADVPFFLYNKPCFATGIGEILTPIDFDLSVYNLLLLMPDIHISTPWAFKNLNFQKKILTTKQEKDRKNRSQFLEGKYFRNDFEEVVLLEYKDILTSKEIMLQSGAVFSSLSGTGASLYGLFSSEDNLKSAVNSLSKEVFFQNWKYVWIKKK